MLDSLRFTIMNWRNFSGRSSRREYWIFAPFYLLFYIGVLYVRYGYLNTDSRSYRSYHYGSMSEAVIGLSIVALLLFLPLVFFLLITYLALVVRRIHDTGRDGAYILIEFIPLVGPLIMLYFMVLRGDDGENHYGPAPGSQPTAAPPSAKLPDKTARPSDLDRADDSLTGFNHFGGDSLTGFNHFGRFS